MPYCPSCGAEVLEEYRFCPKCGAALKPVTPGLAGAETGLERLGRDQELQRHWFKRVVAVVIDWVIVSVGLLLLGLLLGLFFIIPLIPSLLTGGPQGFTGMFVFLNWLGLPFVTGLVYLLYFTLAEHIYGKTIGKALTGLEVVGLEGSKPPLEKAFIRNISKLHWLLLLLDVAVGLATRGDPHQKLTDRIAGTTVK
jgi:uncharacterized RDD family membrane protein YckC